MDWIPCSERLPKTGVLVLVSISGSDLIVVQEGESLWEATDRVRKTMRRVDVGFWSDEEGWEGWTGSDGFPMIVHPAAWMPLPEPYWGDVE